MLGFSKRQLFLVVFLGTFAIVAGGWIAKYLRQNAAPPVTVVTEAPQPLREVLLYFATAEGTGLEAQVREIEGCQDDESCLKATLQALIDGPLTPTLAPVLPAQTKIQKIMVVGGLATVSFNPELVAGHPGGSMTELLTVHALANTLAVNFPHIRQVRVLVDGAPIETLKGHIDLREPIAADFDFGRAQTTAGEARPKGD